MAKNTIAVEVKFTEQLENAKKLFNKSVDEGVYKGVKGQEAKNKVASSINALDTLFKSLKSVDEKDLKVIKEQFKAVLLPPLSYFSSSVLRLFLRICLYQSAYLT